MQTDNLNLKKFDLTAEQNDTMNVETYFNENWDKLDQAVANKAESNDVGDISILQTTQKDNLVGAINENKGEIDSLKLSGNDGKNQLETAIVAKDGTVSKAGSVATFQELDDGVRSIPQGSGNATTGDVLAGKTFTNDDMTEYTGTMPNNGAVNVNLANNDQEYTVPQGYHSGLGKVKAGITGLIASVIKAGTTVGGILGTYTSDANAIASNILSGKTAYVNGSKITGTIPSKGAATITPGTTNQTIGAGKYLSGTQTISGDADLVSANIKAGKNIFGVAGNSNVIDTSAGDAAASQILCGKKACVDGALVTGTMANKTGGYTTDSLTHSGNELRMSIDSAGYFADSAYLRYTDNDWIESNIKKGVNVFGKTGSYEPNFTEFSSQDIACDINTLIPIVNNEAVLFTITGGYSMYAYVPSVLRIHDRACNVSIGEFFIPRGFVDSEPSHSSTAILKIKMANQVYNICYSLPYSIQLFVPQFTIWIDNNGDVYLNMWAIFEANSDVQATQYTHTKIFTAVEDAKNQDIKIIGYCENAAITSFAANIYGTVKKYR